MSQRISRLVPVVAALVQGGARVSDAQVSHNSNTDEAAIRQVVKQVEDGWNAHDGKAFGASFAPDAGYVVVDGMRATGRAEIEQGHTMIFTTISKESRNAGTAKSIRFLRPDVAVVHVAWNLEYSAGGETRKGHAINTMVMTKDGGQWSIAVFQNTPIQAEGRWPGAPDQGSVT
ncbi:MAG: SgcJ/EcaC family oxidoreductase [bacterium]|nr:SgcJ/EcaC family oxidoreductase [bacterium]MBK7702235.1 SgcJ/EcaC family oxidoreductase [bacterium]